MAMMITMRAMKSLSTARLGHCLVQFAAYDAAADAACYHESLGDKSGLRDDGDEGGEEAGGELPALLLSGLSANK